MNSKLKTQQARHLRKNMTDAERKIWHSIKGKKIKNHRFRRQHPIGPYIVDFVCLENRIVIEIDGGQHAWQKETDEKRTKWLESEGYRVIRFWNNQIMNEFNGVIQILWNMLEE